MKGTDHSEDKDVNGRIILKQFPSKYNWIILSGITSLGIGAGGPLLCQR
jgi:hypothetical protein